MEWQESGSEGREEVETVQWVAEVSSKKGHEITTNNNNRHGKAKKFTRSFSKYLQNLYYFPGTVLDTEEAMEDKIDNIPALQEL